MFGKYCPSRRLRIFSAHKINKPQLGYCVRIELYTRKISSETNQLECLSHIYIYQEILQTLKDEQIEEYTLQC